MKLTDILDEMMGNPEITISDLSPEQKREFDVFTFSTNPDIASTAKEISKLYNQLFRAMNALDKLMALEKQGRI